MKEKIKELKEEIEDLEYAEYNDCEKRIDKLLRIYPILELAQKQREKDFEEIFKILSTWKVIPDYYDLLEKIKNIRRKNE